MNANNGFDTSSEQATNSVFSMAHLDIPTYNVGGGSNDNSAHTTPLNYMRRSTPVSSVRKVEQIKERDPYTGLDEESERDLDSKLDLLKLSSTNADDFFQLRDQHDSELQELEPSTGELPHARRNSDLYDDDELMMRYNNGSAKRLDGIDQNYGYQGDQYYGSEHASGRSDYYDPSLSRHDPQPSSMAAQVGFNASHLVMPPADGSADNDALYFNPASRRPPTYGSGNAITPRASWNPSPTNRAHMAGVALGQVGSQQQPPPQYPVRRGGPASPSMLSSYATASAQPHLSSRLIGQPQAQAQQMPHLQPPSPYPAPYAQDHRPPLRDDIPRNGTIERAGYPSHANPRHVPSPVPGLSQSQYGQASPSHGHLYGQGYYGALSPSPSNPSGHGQYPMQAQPRGGGAYAGAQQSSVANYYSSQSLPPVQPDYIFQVQFKRISKYFTNRSGYQIQERDFVVVEGDRGEDIGVVILVLTMQEFVHRRMSDPRTSADSHTVDCILRLATMQERQQLPEKYNAEKAIVQSCNELALHGFGLPIFVYDAEFQFDRNKLTIYYECNVRIDFRDFVRQLYSTYKARIWMKIGNMHTPVDVQPLAAMALATGVYFSGGGGGGTGAGAGGAAAGPAPGSSALNGPGVSGPGVGVALGVAGGGGPSGGSIA